MVNTCRWLKDHSYSRWLDVEVGANDVEIHTLPSDVCLVDLDNDNEYKLIIGDLDSSEDSPKLRIFRGAMQIADNILPDLPLGVISFFNHETTPHPPPVIAVAFSSCIYIYRNLKLFYKYYIPSIELSTTESEVWLQLQDPQNHTPESLKGLTDKLKSIPSRILSLQSQQFISYDEEQQIEYLEQNSKSPITKAPEITCITSLKMTSIEKHGVSCLILGTEDGSIVVLDTQTFTQMWQAKLCESNKTPYRIMATGLYNVGYRLVVATREKSVCLVKKDVKVGRILFTTDEHIIAIEVMTTDNSIMVICTDNTLSCYSKKGKKQWSVCIGHRGVCMCVCPLTHLGVTLVAVALTSGHVVFYHGRVVVDTVFVNDVASVVKFGQLGQEEHVLIIINALGNLFLKILKRTADFNVTAAPTEITSVSHVTSHRPWLIPKRSKLFLEQSMRERENAIGMHDTFQTELNRMRLSAATTLLEAFTKSDNSIAAGALQPVRMSAEVSGLGPIFRVVLCVENTSSAISVSGLKMLFHLHNTAYKIHTPYIKVPLLSPGKKLKFPTKVEEIFDSTITPDVFLRSVTGQGGERSLVKILLIKDGRLTPVLAATVQMPATDPMMLPADKIGDGFT